jgi:uncharacterized spore protein YtfJ
MAGAPITYGFLLGDKAMEEVERLLKATMGEVERMLNSKTVVGEPITIEGATLIPLLSLGFGFGAGGGTGTAKKGRGGEEKGGGAGGGGGVKPVAMVVIDKDGVRLEPITGGTSSVLGKAAEILSKAAQKKHVD